MAANLNLNDDEQALLIELLRREETGLDVQHESRHSGEVSRELFRRHGMVRKLLDQLTEEDPGQSDHQRIAGYC